MLIRIKKEIVADIAIMLVGVLFVFPSAADSLYKWIGDDGTVNYADHPPPNVNQTERVEIGKSASSEIVSAAQEKRASLRQAQREDFQKQSAKAQQKLLQLEAEQVEKERRRNRCAKANEEIQSLNHHMPVYYFDESGNQVFLNDNRRAELIKFYVRETEMFCE